MVPDLGDVDLLIRTGGDQKSQTFCYGKLLMLNLFLQNTPWPDFSVEEFEKIINNFRNVDRRFGMVNNQASIKRVSNYR